MVESLGGLHKVKSVAVSVELVSQSLFSAQFVCKGPLSFASEP